MVEAADRAVQTRAAQEQAKRETALKKLRMLIGDVRAKEQLVEHRRVDLELARRRISDVQEALKLPDERASFELSARLEAAEAEAEKSCC